MTSETAVTRITTAIAALAALVVAIALPLSYFVLSYDKIVGSIEREAEVTALEITLFATQNPEVMLYDIPSLDQILARRGAEQPTFYRRIENSRGEMVAEYGHESPSLEAMHQEMVEGNGFPPLKVQVFAPLEPLVLRTFLMAIAGMALGGVIFVPLRLLPLRAMERAQRSLREANTFLSNIMESTTNGIAVIDQAGKIIVANAQLCELAGYFPDELVGLPLSRLFPEAEFADIEARMGEVVASTAGTTRFEARLLSRGVDMIPVSCGMSTFIHHGEVAGAVLSAEDITDRKVAEESLRVLNDVLEQSVANRTRDLEDINEELRNFAYIVSHDMRAPLVNIKGFTTELKDELAQVTELLPDLTPSPQKAAEYREVVASLSATVPEAFAFIDASVKRMDGQIASILKLSRLGQRVLQPEPLEPAGIVKGILLTLAHQLEVHSGKALVAELPEVVADKTALEQILGNLLDNAVKYLDDSRPGLVEVTGEVVGLEVIFHIRDNGRGIAQADLYKVFDIFKRSGNLDRPGDGMGLAYVKTLVRRIGGRIWCESELGVGSTFSFTVPMAGAGAEVCREAC